MREEGGRSFRNMIIAIKLYKWYCIDHREFKLSGSLG